jgi:hypothetical protein
MWEAIGKLVATIVEKRWLTLLLGGLFVFLIASAGGLHWLPLTDPIWRIIVAVVGILFAIVGAYAMITEPPDEAGSPRENYGLRIINLGENAQVGEHIELEGRYEKKPPANVSVRVFVLSPQRGLYWPSKAPVYFDESNQRWTSSLRPGGKPGDKKFIGIAVLGKNSQALCDFYDTVLEWANLAGDHGALDWQKAFNKNLGYPGIPKFPSDFRECHRIQVIRS